MKSKKAVFLRVATLADCFALHHLVQAREMTGCFVEETEIPFTLWWRIDEVAAKAGKATSVAPGTVGAAGKSLLKAVFDHFFDATTSTTADVTNDKRVAASLPPGADAPARIGGWETGVPAHEVREVQWDQLLTRLILRPDFSRALCGRIVLFTRTKDLLVEAVRNQYRLQQGTITWAKGPGDDDGWLIRIDQPSRWVIDRLPMGPDDILYNLVPRQEQVYLEAGYSFEDVRNAGAFGRFRFWENQHLFIDHQGRLKALNPVWKPAVELVDIKIGATRTWEAAQTEPIEIALRLRPVEDKQRASLWHVQDLERLRGLLHVTGYDRLSGFFVWLSGQEAWILGRHAQVDQGMVAGLSEAFPAFHAYRDRVFLPLGKVLSPMLPEEKLFEAFGVVPGELLVILPPAALPQATPNSAAPGGYKLPESAQKALGGIVQYFARRALLACGEQEDRFRFSFPAIRKHPQEVVVDLPGGKEHGSRRKARPLDEQTEAGASPTTRQESSRHAEEKLPTGVEDELTRLHQTLARIREIDRELVEDIVQTSLWRERASLGRRMEDRMPSLISHLTAEILDDSPEAFLRHIAEGAAAQTGRSAATPSALIAANPGEQDKGRFLAEIRRDTVPAELWYAWHLAFGARFEDRDIFEQALEAMRSGFCDDQRRFFDFSERSFERDGAQAANAAATVDPAAATIQTMGFERMSEISENIAHFFGVVDRLEPLASRVLRLQMRQILLAQCPLLSTPNVLFTQELLARADEMWTEQLLPSSRVAAGPPPAPEWSVIAQHLLRFARFESISRALPIVLQWKQLLDRPLAHCSLLDLFTGDLFRGLFPVHTQKDMKKKAEGAFTAWRKRDPAWSLPLQEVGGKKKTMLSRPIRQRTLLYLVTQFAPSAEFQPFIRLPLTEDLVRDGGTLLHGIAMNGDAYRLMQVYKMPVDEEELFPTLIGHLPSDDGEFLDFRDAAEQIVQCLFLSNSARRQEWLDRLLERSLAWWPRVAGREDFQIDLLMLVAFLQIGLLLDLVPETLARHHFQARRRGLWIDHAARWSREADAFARWRQAWSAATMT